MRVYCRPGANAAERLEAHLAHYLRSEPAVAARVAELLIWATSSEPARAEAIRRAFSQGGAPDPAEALGTARAVLVLCGLAPEREKRLTGNPREDFLRLLEGEYRAADIGSPAAYSVPSLLESYCYMGAGFSRGMDRVFEAVTGHPLSHHVHRALSLLSPAV